MFFHLLIAALAFLAIVSRRPRPSRSLVIVARPRDLGELPPAGLALPSFVDPDRYQPYRVEVPRGQSRN